MHPEHAARAKSRWHGREQAPVSRSAVLLAVGLLLAVGVFWWSGTGSGPPAPPDQPIATSPASDALAPAAAPAPLHADPGPTDRSPAPDRVPVGTTAATPQGLRGLVLDETERPLPGVQVHLLESASNDPLGLPLLLQQRLPASALATTESQPDGTFAIGLPRVQDRIYELYLLSPRHATVRLADLRLLAGEWHDLGAITMGPGATLHGRVTVEGLAMPVPNAVITVHAGTTFDDVARRGLDDGHHGLVATTDASGHYELRNAPGRGVVRVSAVAPGFARVVRQDIELTVAQPIELDFALPPGWTLRGEARDPAGHPVSQARVEVWPSKSAAAAFLTTSDPDGVFAVQGLSTGPHRVRVSARGFQTAEVTDVEAGRQDVQVVLARRGSVQVRVKTPEGAILRDYQLSIRRYFDDRGGQIGFVADVPEQGVHLDGWTDHADVDGLPAGIFVAEVVAVGWAKTLSAPFAIAGVPPAEPPWIEVTMSRGATLRGRVFAEDGTPLPGATVVTQAAGADPDSPIWKLLASSVPDRITATRTTTDAEGTFVLPQLALGDYQLEVDHAEACRTLVRSILVDRPVEQTVPPIHLAHGAAVSGHATVGGRRAGQIKVVLVEANAGRQGPTARFETVTDAQGAFRIPRRVPPGTYELRAAVVGTVDPDAHILQQLLQLQRSSITVVVTAGQAVVERDIDIPDQH